ncbi:hypothetical protein AB4144_26430, partial [Rhizobiaceae sp. 2RAB30]
GILNGRKTVLPAAVSFGATGGSRISMRLESIAPKRLAPLRDADSNACISKEYETFLWRPRRACDFNVRGRDGKGRVKRRWRSSFGQVLLAAAVQSCDGFPGGFR